VAVGAVRFMVFLLGLGFDFASGPSFAPNGGRSQGPQG
jgi:hypothetical protein